MDDKQKQMIEVLQQGLQDEMNSAYNYIALAGKYGNGAIKTDFLDYASDELNHASKLVRMLQQFDAEVEEIPVTADEMDDLYLYLIEYMAREESAVFYYEALEKLVQEPGLQRMCKEMQGEEQVHLHKMKELYQRVKEQNCYA